MYLKPMDMIRNIILVILYSILSLITFSVVGSGLHLMLAWNIFLAFIPIGLVYLFDKGIIKNKILNIAVLLLWLLFYPNSIYVLTDFIYLDSPDFMTSSYFGIEAYLMNLPAYLAFFHIAFGVIISFYFGMKSLHVLYLHLAKSEYQKYRHWFVGVVSILAGIAIYVGRFFRYNSWDFVRFWVIIRDLFQSIDWFLPFFVGMLASLQLLFFYLFMHEKKRL
ncbi:MAG: DUF1361 domain-containing protein [Bacilli bacterium]|nr:DUF1361 domain-containing protein [Bacilli bacterium]MBN2876825.1 DUF1361 domain-containing protein [Bacilli bacterium]